jgi:GTP-binding protein HflX
VLLHVIDISNPEWEEQARVVDELIRQLGAESTPCIRVFNKCDAYMGILPHGEDIVCISAKNGEGAAELVARLSQMLDKGKRRVCLKIPYSATALVDTLNREAIIHSMEYTDEGVEAEVTVPPEIFGKVKAYIPGYVEPKEDWE